MHQAEFIAAGLLITVFVATGIGILLLAELAMPGRRVSNPTRVRYSLQIPGAILLVVGICLMATVVASVFVHVLMARLGVDDAAVEIIASVAAGLMLSLYPVAGGLLLGVGSLADRVRTDAETKKLYRLLHGLTVIGWSLTVFGIILLFFCLPLFGLFGCALILVLLGSIFGMRRSSQRDGLLWVLAIAAGKQMPLAPAVREYAEQCHGWYRGWLTDLADRLAAGVALPDAIAARPGLLRPDARLAVRVGWDSGVLGEALRDAALDRSLHQPVWNSIVERLLYLTVPLIVLQSVAGFMLYFIVPKFRKIFFDFGVPLPKSTQLICSVGGHYVYGISFPILMLGEFAFLLYLVTAYMGWFSLNPPLLDRVFRSADRALLLRTLAVYVRRDQPLIAGLTSLSDFYPKLWVRLRLAYAVEWMTQGNGWSESLHRFGLIRHNDVALLESAQRVGNLAWALRMTADRAERRLSYQLQLACQWLFPLLVVCVAGVVFTFALGFFEPVVRLITEMAQ